MYYFIELAGSITNIALLSLFMSRLFVRNKACALCHLKRFPICEEAVSRRLTEWVFASAAASQKHA